MSGKMIQRLLNNMDEEQLQSMMENVDEEQIEQQVAILLDKFVLPHLDDIRQRSREEPPTKEVRVYYEQMTPEEREEKFYEHLDELVATLVMCRERPRDGFSELKKMLRDPYVTEALLLIFENEEHIDEEYTAQLKDFGVEHIRWIGAMVVPEMYDDSEVEEVLDQFNIDPDSGDFDGDVPDGAG